MAISKNPKLNDFIDKVADFTISNLPVGYSYMIIAVDEYGDLLVVRNIPDEDMELIADTILETPDESEVIETH
jgi:hypothetical protein